MSSIKKNKSKSSTYTKYIHTNLSNQIKSNQIKSNQIKMMQQQNNLLSMVKDVFDEIRIMREFINNVETKCKKIIDVMKLENNNDNNIPSTTNDILYQLIDSEEEEINEICDQNQNQNQDIEDQSTQEYEQEPVVVVNPEIVQPQPSDPPVLQDNEPEVQSEPEVQIEPVQQNNNERGRRRGRKKKENPAIESITDLAHENMLKDYNAKDLRSFLKVKKLSTKGKKYELMLRVFKAIMHPNQLTDEDKPKKKGRKNRNNQNENENVVIQHSHSLNIN